MVLEVIAIILSSFAIVCSIIGVAWSLGRRIGRLEGEVKGHNDRLDDVTAELKAINLNFQTKRKRRQTW